MNETESPYRLGVDKFRLESTIKMRKQRLDKLMNEAVSLEDEIANMQKELDEINEKIEVV